MLTVIIDTREQRPWSFSPLVTVVRKKLDTGDYSLKGFEKIVRIERKGPDEIWSMVGSSSERFKSQLSRLGKFPVRALVIEGTLEDIIHRPEFSTVSYTNFMYRLMQWTTSYCVPVWFLGSRCQATTTMIEELFKAISYNLRTKRGFAESFGWKEILCDHERVDSTADDRPDRH